MAGKISFNLLLQLALRRQWLTPSASQLLNEMRLGLPLSGPPGD